MAKINLNIIRVGKLVEATGELRTTIDRTVDARSEANGGHRSADGWLPRKSVASLDLDEPNSTVIGGSNIEATVTTTIAQESDKKVSSTDQRSMSSKMITDGL